MNENENVLAELEVQPTPSRPESKQQLIENPNENSQHFSNEHLSDLPNRPTVVQPTTANGKKEAKNSDEAEEQEDKSGRSRLLWVFLSILVVAVLVATWMYLTKKKDYKDLDEEAYREIKATMAEVSSTIYIKNIEEAELKATETQNVDQKKEENEPFKDENLKIVKDIPIESTSQNNIADIEPVNASSAETRIKVMHDDVTSEQKQSSLDKEGEVLQPRDSQEPVVTEIEEGNNSDGSSTNDNSSKIDSMEGRRKLLN